MRDFAFQTLDFATYFTIYHHLLFNLLRVKDILAVIAIDILFFVFLDIFFNYNVRYLMKLLLGEQGFDIVYIDWLSTIFIGTG